ncbi:MAG: molybdopterin cofactor-binding domain-containing protein, partial [Candidatus Dormibacteraceae bacterium]
MARGVLELRVNGVAHTVAVPSSRLLSDVLRWDLGLTGTRVGCGDGTCGSCTVLVDGQPRLACLMLAGQVAGSEVLTIEGVEGPDGEPHPLQRAFRDAHAVQCGYCTAGFVMAALPLLDGVRNLDDRSLRRALGAHVCRCTGYAPILDAIRAAAEETGLPSRAATPTRESARHVRGRGLFVEDLAAGAARLSVIRSPHAHARIVGIDTVEVTGASRVLAAYAAADLPAQWREPLPVISPHEGLTAPRTPCILAGREVSSVGEPVAVAIALDQDAADQAASRVRVDYEALPQVPTLAAATSGAALAHLDMEDNVFGRYGHESGDVEAALAAAPHRRTWRFAIDRTAGLPLECRAVVARFEPRERRLLVFTNTQVPHYIRAGLIDLTGLPDENVDVVAPDVGGSFGSKDSFYPEYALTALAAIRLERPVAWIEDRAEHLVATYHESGQAHEVTVGFDEEGRILAIDHRFDYDSGAYCQWGMLVPENTVGHVVGPYRVPNYRYAYRLLSTNTVPTSVYRSAGRQQGAFVMSRIIDHVAADLGLDRIQVHRLNLTPAGDPAAPDSGDYPRAFEILLERVGLEALPAARAAVERSGRRFGLGLACHLESSGRGPYEGAAVEVHEDGSVSVAVGVTSQGQGHETAFAHVVAGELGVDEEVVRVSGGDTRTFHHGLGTFGSRSAVMAGNAVLEAARSVADQLASLAAERLAVRAADLRLIRGTVRALDGRSIPIGDLATLASPVPFHGGPSFSRRARHARATSD